MRRFKKQSDLSLYEYKFDLSYCQWNTREPRVVPNVSLAYVFFMIIQSPTISSSYISSSLACTEHSRIAASLMVMLKVPKT